MERFIPVEGFRKKGNNVRDISFFSLLPEFPKISVPFVHRYSARLFTVILPRKNAKDLKDGGRFPNRLKSVSLLVGSVGRRFRTQLQPCMWKRIKFCGRYLRFSFTCMIRASSVLPPDLHRWEQCLCWFPWRNMDAAGAKRKNCRQTHNFPSRPLKRVRLARQGVQSPFFLLTWYVPRPRPTGIRKFRSNDKVQSLSFPQWKKVQFYLSTKKLPKISFKWLTLLSRGDGRRSPCNGGKMALRYARVGGLLKRLFLFTCYED